MRAPKYLRAFGLFQGLRLLFAIERSLPDQASRSRSFRVPGLAHPVMLRACNSDHETFWQCFARRQYSLHDMPHRHRFMQAYQEMIASGARPVIVDGGGNVGLSAVWFAEAFPEAVVVTVEPDAANFEVLKQNIAPYGERIWPVLGAVCAEGGRFVVDNPDDEPNAFRMRPAADGEEGGAVDGYTIAELVALGGGDVALIVKIDIEGGEKDLFEGNTGWVAGCSLIIVELHDWMLPWAGTSRSLFRCLSAYPLDYVLKGENVFFFRDFEEE